MKNDTDSDGQEPVAHARPGNSGSALRTSRRRFGKAGLAAPVIMTLASRPVWATGRQCTVSALASANPSRPVDESTCQACSPGYWHHTNSCWPAGWDRGTPFYAQFGYNLQTYKNLRDAGQTVAPGRTEYVDIVEALETPLGGFFPAPFGDSGLKPLSKAMRGTLAAMLNAVHPNVPFVLATGYILSQLDAVFPGPEPSDPEKPTATKGDLEAMASSFSDYWDELSDECILPNNGDCP
jgi:hypothetical protein